MEVKNIVCYSNYLNNQDAMAHLRIIGPFRQAGINIINGWEKGKPQSLRVSDGDIVFIQREFPAWFGDYQKIVEDARLMGKPIVFDLDDLLFFLPESHPDRKSQYFVPSLLPMYEALKEADLVTVSTPKLKEVLSRYNQNVVVLPNYFDETLWQLRPPVLKPRGEILTIGFMGGNSHIPDIEYVLPVLQDLIKRYHGQIRLSFWGLQPPAALLSLPQVVWTPHYSDVYKEFSTFFQTQSADIFIAPLVDNLFNRSKSPLKFFEYTALGTACVLSRLETYTDVVTHGYNGLLASSLDEWTDCLIQLIENGELRLRLAYNAQSLIRKDWLLSQNAFRWQEVFRNLSGEISPKPQDQDEIVHSAIIQLAEKFEEDQAVTAQVAQKEQEVHSLRAQLEENEQEMQSLKVQLEEEENSVQELIAEKNRVEQDLQWFSTQLAERSHTIDVLTNEKNEAQREAVSYALSTSWKITRPFRRIMGKFKKGRTAPHV